MSLNALTRATTLFTLVRARLENLRLAAPVRALRLGAEALIDAGDGASPSLFTDTASDAEVLGVLLARLRAPLVFLAVNADGYAKLAELISHTQLAGEKHAPAPLSLEALSGNAAGLIALSGGKRGRIARAVEHGDADAAIAAALALREAFGDCAYIELEHHLRPEDAAVVAGLVAVAAQAKLPIAATGVFSGWTVFRAIWVFTPAA